MSERPVVMWFRRDLRTQDNDALALAARLAAGSAVLPIFVIDPLLARRSGRPRAAYLGASLASLNESLGGTLATFTGSPVEVLRELVSKRNVAHVVATNDAAPYGRSRDRDVAAALAGLCDVHFVGSNYVVAPGTLESKAGTPIKVFTAFKRQWEPVAELAPVTSDDVRYESVGAFDASALYEHAGSARPLLFAGLDNSIPDPLPEAGERAALDNLEDFLPRAARYGEDRNRPDLNATSHLSRHLRFGELHPRQVLRATADIGSETFRSEIVWREFYADVLFHHPSSVREELQPVMRNLRVDRDDAAGKRFRAWANGQTGYPLVDAGMRQLLREGWMHNRVRMVAASFLVKHLHLDWRWGARWFMDRLIDGDLASNQHGWQWTAGTGTDAAPFHRVFNPTLQAERFDPNGDYVRRYIGELDGVPAPQCLQPGGPGGLLSQYVAPIIDANTERVEALARFGEARGQRG